jgi:archaellum component FlaC
MLSGVTGVKCPILAGRPCMVQFCGFYNVKSERCSVVDIASNVEAKTEEVEQIGQTQNELDELKTAIDKISNDVFTLKSMMGKVKKRVFTAGNEANTK